MARSRSAPTVVTLFVAFFSFTGIMLVLGSPVLVVAWRRGRMKTLQRFLVTAGIVGLFCAVISAGSERLVRDCQDAGNPDCVDYGASGLQILAVGGYLIISWLKAILISREAPSRRTRPG